MKIFDTNISALEKDLSFRLKRQNLIASNLAHANTPGYRSKDIKFNDALRDVYESERGSSTKKTEMSVSNEKHMIDPDSSADSSGEIDKYIVQAPGIDENGVDLDREMARMAENSIMYSASAMAARKKLGILKYAATAGGS
ncbi:MAG: flagellar basal body rod protein FlgB [bacterium]